MIREPQSGRNVLISVYLKNGDVFENKDVPTQPAGEHEKVISFWDGDSIVVYPISEVHKWIYHF